MMKVETRGRPSLNLTSEEKTERRRQTVLKSREKLDTVNLSIDGDLLEKFKTAKTLQSKEWGVDLTNKQFFKLLIALHYESKGWELNS